MARQMATSAFHKPKTLDNKYQEIDLLKNLNHKNIVKYLGSLKTKTHLHIILEYVENGSLANIVKPNKFGPFPESLVAVYIAQVLEGLVYLHEQGVIHRDIKGANILLTKEGLVKLADFGVATKLTEADFNTHSVAGTPYWMAPEVIEMSGVCAASDIWSVGCTVIELLTCVPPYYDLQPMPALFRIVQDEHPPIPESLSPDINDFLLQCFKKDARQRPDARALLSHPWIQNSRRALQRSLRYSRSLRNIDEVESEEAVSNGGERRHVVLTSSAEKEFQQLPSEAEIVRKSIDNGVSNANHADGRPDNLVDNLVSNHAPTINERLDKQTSSSRLVGDNEPSCSYFPGDKTSEFDQRADILKTDELNPYGSTKENTAVAKFDRKSTFNAEYSKRNKDYSPRKVVRAPIHLGGHELSKFSDLPNDASLDDLFHPLEELDDEMPEASTSASASSEKKGDRVPNNRKTDLATRLRATIAKKQKENGSAQANGGDLIRLMMGVLKEDATDNNNNLGFEDKLPPENAFHIQAVQFSKLVSCLRPDEPEEVILSACQKLTTFLKQRPEQKIVFIKQHGLLPLMELLEVQSSHVISSVIHVLNLIVKDNTDILESACLIGLIPVVLNFAVPERPREVRLETAFFIQQLCQSSSLTLQMFIACRGILILVGFLEPDYAKYREMVHMAIDGMWQVFKLDKSHSRNDFCRIASKNGILLRLVNTLYSLNEAARLSSIASGGGFPSNLLGPHHRFGSVDSLVQLDTPGNQAYELDNLEVNRGGQLSQAGLQEHSQASGSLSPESKIFTTDANKPRSSSMDASGTTKVSDPLSSDRGSNSLTRDHHSPIFRDQESVDRWRNEPARAEAEDKHPHRVSECNRDRNSKSAEAVMDGSRLSSASQQENLQPLLSVLDKEPPSLRLSGQLGYAPHFTGTDKYESVLPPSQASANKKTNGLDYLMAEFSEVSVRGRENSADESLPRSLSRATSKKLGHQTSNARVGSPAASGVLSGSGVLISRSLSGTSSGLLTHAVSPWNIDIAQEYLQKVADLLLEFAAADTAVKSYMCSQSLLSRLFQMFNKIEPPILLKLLKCINHLSMDPHCLEQLQRADAIKYLVPNLDLNEGSLVQQIHHEVLNSLFNLCKINKRRQEQAAENGIIPHLMQFIVSGSPLKQYALPLLCDMAHASRNAREQLRAHGGLDVYLNLLEDELWSVTALDSMAVCLAHDSENRKVEQALLKKEAAQKLVSFFQHCTEQQFLHILEPFLKIITKSPRINTTLAVNGLTPLLISRLDHPDAIARLNLLKLIKAVYEHHPRPKQLIVENDLPQKLQNLIEERRDGQSSGGQVLVKQMATSLLKALHINTVL
ncbi:MAP3K epsilon protein kinase 1-like isoform X2 [Andrographis paniculata]|uniref:MAP3K epsilon protein kinase 1-like isoform X2 n=1 Tax=Andrographis paniculata TaxID=175694 RepID=UPI0021E71B14|nr:MAP3K epsilon protein kinase 1-like isoform X2 [Andrographis paniculata]